MSQVPLEKNASPENSAGFPQPPTIWNQPAPVNPKNLYPKKKHKWGILEVVIAFAIFICTQVIITIALLAVVTTNAVANGVTDVELIINEDIQKALYTPLVLIASSASMYFSWSIMMFYSTKFRGLNSWAKDFWLKFKLPKDILLGLGIAGLGFGLVQGVSALLTALGVNMAEASNTETFSQLEGFWRFFFFIAVVSIIGPTFEELFFRGFLMQALIRHFRRGNINSPAGSISSYFYMNYAPVFVFYRSVRNFLYRHKYMLSAILSSIVFGFMHFQGTSLGQMMTVLITAMLGFVFALITIKTRRLGPAIFGHIFYNGTVAIFTLISLG